MLTANAASAQIATWLEMCTQVDGHPAHTGPMDDSIEQAHRFGAIPPLVPVPVPAPGVWLVLTGHRPQLVAGPPDAVELVVAAQVDGDDIDNERLVHGRGSRRGNEIDRVEVVSTQAPATPLVPFPDVVELLAEGNKHLVRRCRRKLGLAGRQLAVIHAV